MSHLHLQTLPIHVLVHVLSFEPPIASRLRNVLSILLGRSSLSTTEVDYVFQALCRSTWHSCNTMTNSWRPNLNSWHSLYQVLECWVPREGFYSILEASPFGLLLRLRFIDGKIIGELIAPLDEEDSNKEEDKDTTNKTNKTNKTNITNKTNTTNKSKTFETTRVLEIEFSAETVATKNVLTSTPKITICGTLVANATIEFGPQIDVASMQQNCPANSVSNRAITIKIMQDKDKDTTDTTDNDTMEMKKKVAAAGIADLGKLNREIRYGMEMNTAWDPKSNTSFFEMFEVLFLYNSKITLDYIDGPTRSETFQYEEGMPVIKPGLYSGVYNEDLYGKFKREIVLIQYKTYQPEEDVNYLKNIHQEVFNNNVHRDSNGIFLEFCNQQEQFFNQNTNLKKNKTKDKIIIVLGRKVNGDFHVPMRQLTFGAVVHPSLNLNGGNKVPSVVVDRGGKQQTHRVMNSWDGFGTLAYPNFQNPGWSNGRLLQVETKDGDAFAFQWGDDAGSSSVLKRMSEQDMFEWFS